MKKFEEEKEVLTPDQKDFNENIIIMEATLAEITLPEEKLNNKYILLFEK